MPVYGYYRSCTRGWQNDCLEAMIRAAKVTDWAADKATDFPFLHRPAAMHLLSLLTKDDTLVIPLIANTFVNPHDLLVSAKAMLQRGLAVYFMDLDHWLSAPLLESWEFMAGFAKYVLVARTRKAQVIWRGQQPPYGWKTKEKIVKVLVPDEKEQAYAMFMVELKKKHSPNHVWLALHRKNLRCPRTGKVPDVAAIKKIIKAARFFKDYQENTEGFAKGWLKRFVVHHKKRIDK